MNPILKRAAVTVAVFAGVCIASQIFVSAPAYDASVRATEFLAAVVGAGCYWVGSRK